MTEIADDETLLAFQVESREHLDGIENDLLDIEENGVDNNPDLVNKVFRAMHSIKGGAGFLGLDKVKELAHAAENILNLLRNHELIPSTAVVSRLLDGADVLCRLINNPGDTDSIDISSQVSGLKAILSGETPAPTPAERANPPVAPAPTPVAAAAPPPSVDRSRAIPGARDTISICSTVRPDGLPLFSVPAATIDGLLRKGNNFYLFTWLPHQVGRWQDISPIALFADIGKAGQMLAATISPGSPEATIPIGSLTLPLVILYSTVLEQEHIQAYIDLPTAQIHAFSPTAFKGEATPIMTGSEKVGGDSATAEVMPSPPVAVAEAKAIPSAPAPAKPAPSVVRKTEERTAEAPQAARGQNADASLRVNVKILDNLMTLAGELVLTRNQMIQTVNSRNFQSLDTVSQRLDLITSELQEAIMCTRMQPVGNVFNKFKRVVRDLSQNLGKEINLIIEGAEVELDKTIIEAMGDPLTHLVRNSVDHGIEGTEERVRAGKSLAGTLRLSAFHEGGHVIIEIYDDGAGIDTQRVKDKALKMGTHDRLQLEAMTDKELARLIFTPGLSTAKQVTDVSGRGVGMDVVHANLTKVGGNIDIDTRPGKGTTISIKLPLTLAIIPSLIVTVESERYAIPQVNLVELVRIPARQVKDKIERIGSAMVMRLRGELLPLIRLADVLGIEQRSYIDPETNERQPCRRMQLEDRRCDSFDDQGQPLAAPTTTSADRRAGADRREHPQSAYNILVVSAGNFHYGLIVDKLLDSEEIVVKPLGTHLRKIKGYAGATIQGDGKVALILDVVGISVQMHLAAVAKKAKDRQSGEDDMRLNDKQTLLIVRNANDEQLAVPIDLVSRIEKIKRRDVELTGGRRNIKYRGSALPLFGIEETAKIKPIETESPYYYIIVFPLAGREVGIVVGEIVDIIEISLTIDDTTHRQPGIMGSSIILDQITLLVDLCGVVGAIMPEWTRSLYKNEEKSAEGAKILIAEDTKFFNNKLCEFLIEAGFTPLKAFDGVEALEILQKHPVDILLTDIEMPRMDGLELTRQIRANPKWARLPIIAVTSLAGEAAEKRGLEVGINEYLVKLNREQIITTIRKFLKRR